MKEFFEFEHLMERKELINNTVKLLKDADEERVKLISKVIRAIVG